MNPSVCFTGFATCLATRLKELYDNSEDSHRNGLKLWKTVTIEFFEKYQYDVWVGTDICFRLEINVMNFMNDKQKMSLRNKH